MGKAGKEEAQGSVCEQRGVLTWPSPSCLAGKLSKDGFQSGVSLFEMSISYRASICVPLQFG